MNLHSFFGISRIRINESDSVAFINICSFSGIRTYKHEFSDGFFFCNIPIGSENMLKFFLDKNDIRYSIINKSGLVPFFSRYRHRCGILAGFILFMALITITPKFLWNIEITGNETVDDKSIIEALEKSGLYLGCYLPNLNIDKIESSALVNEKMLSWISVNMSGTTAYIEVRERVDADVTERELPYANVVATHDALISEIEVYSGMASVKKDSYVRKGDLLINGIITKEALGTHITYASGRVIGRVFTEYEFNVPFTYETMTETGNSSIALRFVFFGKSFTLDLPSKDFAEYNEYSEDYILSEGKRKLPISMVRIQKRESIKTAAQRSYNEAVSEANKLLSSAILNDYPDSELISKDIVIEENGVGIILRANICIECEIGKTVEFDVTD